MKNYLIVVAAMFMIGGYALAEESETGYLTASNTGTVSGVNSQPLAMGDYVTMTDGNMMVIRSGMMELMDVNITLPNGTVVMKNGSYRLPNGSVNKMKDGDRIDVNGNLSSDKVHKINNPAH